MVEKVAAADVVEFVVIAEVALAVAADGVAVVVDGYLAAAAVVVFEFEIEADAVVGVDEADVVVAAVAVVGAVEIVVEFVVVDLFEADFEFAEYELESFVDYDLSTRFLF